MNDHNIDNTVAMAPSKIRANAFAPGRGPVRMLLTVGATFAVVVALELWQRFVFPLPELWTVALIPVAAAAYQAGIASGLAAALTTIGYLVWDRYSPLGLHNRENIAAIAVASVVSTSIAILLGLLHRQQAMAQARLRAQHDHIAERERTFAAMEESRAEHRNIFNIVPAMIWFKDPDGRILRANKLAAESIGRRLNEVEGQSTWDLYPTQARAYQRDDEEVIRTGRPKLGIIELYETPDGADKWVRTDKIPLRNERDEIIGVVVFAVDITEQRVEQQALQRVRDEMEERVRERTEQLHRTSADLDQAIDEKKRMERQLRHGEERLQAILDHTTAVIYMKDQAGRYVLVNRRHSELFHLDANFVIGKTDREIFPAEIADAFRSNDRLVLERRQTVEFEERAPLDDGIHTYISLKFPVFDPQGEMVGIGGISTDITDRKRAEEAMQRSEARLRTMTDTIAAAAFIFQGDRLLDANPAAERITGYRKDELIGRDFWLVIHPEHRDLVRSRGSARQQGATIPPSYEVRVLRKDGETRWVSFTAGMIEIDNKPAVFGTAFDITDRKNAEEATLERLHFEERVAAVSKTLLASSGKAEAMQEALEHLLHASDVSRVYVFENFLHPTYGLCMRQTHEVCAKGVTPQIDNPLLQSLPYSGEFARWGEELSAGRPVRSLVKHLPPAERAVLESQDIVSILVLPIHSAGQWYGFIGFDDTQSPRAWTDGDVGLLATAAEMIGAYLSRERAEQELLAAKDAAETASRAKSQFLANISHEIKTPITTVLMVAEALRDGGPDKQSLIQQSETILRNGQHLLALVTDLLDVSRIEAGRLDVDLSVHSLFDILADVEAVTAPLARAKPITFSVRHVTPLPARVRTDRRWLTQAVVNLVNNAIKYTDQGKVEVRIGCEADASPARLKIAVEDTGVGIAPQDVERIFETFTQVRAMSQRTSEGFGLGLSIARSIAQRLGGALTVQSTLGRGSTFTLTVPVETPADVKWIEPGALPEHPGFVPVHRSRLQGRVLLADDAVDVRRTMTKALRDAGADVVAVADGVDALNAVRSPNEFDLILLDLRMPKLDGEKTAAELRRRGCRSAVIAFTAHAATGDRDTVVKAGFDDVWSKPISLQELVERASAYLPGTDSLSPEEAARRSAASAAGYAEIRAEYVNSLGSKMQAIRSLLKQEKYEDAYEEVHKITGGAGLQGFMDVSKAAGDLEMRLIAGRTAEIPRAFERLEQIVEAAVRGAKERQGD